jgi:PAS domain S-box-containing protein
MDETVDALRKRIITLEKINTALMHRVERSVDTSASAYALFERTITLQDRVDQYTRELEAKHAELTVTLAQLRASEDLLARTGEAARVGGWELDLRSGAVRWTAQTRRIHEVPPDFVPTLETLFGFYPAAAAEQLRAAVEACRSEGTPWDLEVPFVTAQGRHLWVRVQGRAELEQGRAVRLSGPFQDTTARREVEEAIRRERRRLQYVIEGTHAGTWEWHVDTGDVVVNDYGAQMLGYTPLDFRLLSKDRWWALVHPDDAEGARGMLQAHLEGGCPYVDQEYRVRHHDGHWVWVQQRGKVVEQGDGALPRLVAGTVLDVTARRLADDRLRETNRQLTEAESRARQLADVAEAANRSKSEFLANVSHEIRTPLNGVLGMASLLRDTPLAPDQRRLVETISTSGELLLGVINDILDISKMEAGRLDITPTAFVVGDLLEGLAASLAIRAHQAGLELVCLVDPGVPPVLVGDVARLRQVLTNLTANAIKFTQAGDVIVRVSPLVLVGREAAIRFSVQDSGIGIPPQKVDEIFEKFTQADGSTTRRHGGTGLGLPISRQLVELMGGAIGVESPEGTGSEFWFTLPLTLPATAPVSLPSPPILEGASVLIVDDHHAHRELMTALLSGWGMVVTAAAEASTALRLLRDAAQRGTPCAVVIVDAVMPGYDGPTLEALIRGDAALGAPALVRMVPLGMRAEAQGEGRPDGVVVKPPRRVELRRVLCDVLGGAPPPRAPEAPHTSRQSLRASARVLLVEDNLVNQRVALGMLAKLGVEADVAGTGVEAVRAFDGATYDLVLMDVQMPDMDGLQATRIIRETAAIERRPHVPIVAVTAHAMQGDRERCLAAGMDDYLVLDRWLDGQSRTPEVPTS